MSFRGPAGRIARIHRAPAEEKRRTGDARFLHALNDCEVRPEPQQLATHIERALHGRAASLYDCR
jgi:chromate transporter